MIECKNCGSLNEDEVCSSCGLGLSNKDILEYDDDPQVIIREITKPVILGKGLFTMGSFGSMMVMMTSLYMGIITFLNSISSGDIFRFEDTNLFVIMIISIVFLLIGFILISIGFLGFFSNYKNKFALVTMVICILFPILFFMVSITGVDFHSYSSDYHAYQYYSVEPWLWIGHAFIGITLTFIGISLLLVREYTGMKKRCTSAAILSFITGGLLIGGVGLIAFAWFFLAVLALLLCLIFLKSPIKPYPKMVLVPYYPTTSQPINQSSVEMPDISKKGPSDENDSNQRGQ